MASVSCGNSPFQLSSVVFTRLADVGESPLNCSVSYQRALIGVREHNGNNVNGQFILMLSWLVALVGLDEGHCLAGRVFLKCTGELLLCLCCTSLLKMLVSSFASFIAMMGCYGVSLWASFNLMDCTYPLLFHSRIVSMNLISLFFSVLLFIFKCTVSDYVF